VGRDRSGGVAVAEAPGGVAVAEAPADVALDGVDTRDGMPAFDDATGPVPVSGPPPAPVPIERARQRTGGWRLPWATGLAAAAAIALAVGFGAGSLLQVDRVASREAQIEILERSAQTTVRIERQADAMHVGLSATPAGGAATGSLVFSPSTGEIVVTADGLAHEPAGKEYGCWVDVNGVRTRLGKMYWGGEVATWAGPAKALADLPAGAQFGVSLGPVGGGPGSEPVLVGHT
jgi:hypothetical protein